MSCKTLLISMFIIKIVLCGRKEIYTEDQFKNDLQILSQHCPRNDKIKKRLDTLKDKYKKDSNLNDPKAKDSMSKEALEDAEEINSLDFLDYYIQSISPYFLEKTNNRFKLQKYKKGNIKKIEFFNAVNFNLTTRRFPRYQTLSPNVLPLIQSFPFKYSENEEPKIVKKNVELFENSEKLKKDWKKISSTEYANFPFKCFSFSREWSQKLIKNMSDIKEFDDVFEKRDEDQFIFFHIFPVFNTTLYFLQKSNQNSVRIGLESDVSHLSFEQNEFDLKSMNSYQHLHLARSIFEPVLKMRKNGVLLMNLNPAKITLTLKAVDPEVSEPDQPVSFFFNEIKVITKFIYTETRFKYLNKHSSISNNEKKWFKYSNSKYHYFDVAYESPDLWYYGKDNSQDLYSLSLTVLGSLFKVSSFNPRRMFHFFENLFYYKKRRKKRDYAIKYREENDKRLSNKKIFNLHLKKRIDYFLPESNLENIDGSDFYHYLYEDFSMNFKELTGKKFNSLKIYRYRDFLISLMLNHFIKSTVRFENTMKIFYRFNPLFDLFSSSQTTMLKKKEILFLNKMCKTKFNQSFQKIFDNLIQVIKNLEQFKTNFEKLGDIINITMIRLLASQLNISSFRNTKKNFIQEFKLCLNSAKFGIKKSMEIKYELMKQLFSTVNDLKSNLEVEEKKVNSKKNENYKNLKTTKNLKKFLEKDVFQKILTNISSFLQKGFFN